MEKQEKVYDVAVVGAGAAGLMTAIQCRRKPLKVLLLDGREKIGAKILMSGGTRCNVTNREVGEKDFSSGEIRKVRNILKAFSSEKSTAFFRELGVELILEEGGKYFPATHSARTVLDALTQEIRKTGAALETGKKVVRVRFENNAFTLEGASFQHQAKSVVLTTGGLSYPATGSDGAGYQIAQTFGHKIIPTSPALTPLLTHDPVWKSLAGVSLSVRLSLYLEGKKEISFEGGFLFTHFGFSGPAVLNLSRSWVRASREGRREIRVDFVPFSKEEDLRKELEKTRREHAAWQVKRFLNSTLPERLSRVLLIKSGIPEDRVFAQVRKEEIPALLRQLFHCTLPVTGVFGYAKAEVTAGGIDLAEVEDATLQSKIRPGLFFAGEILDADGRIGGFNFQWAWSTGTVAAEGVRNYLSKSESVF